MFNLSRIFAFSLIMPLVSCGISRHGGSASKPQDDNPLHNYAGGFDSSFDNYIGESMYDFRIPGATIAVIKGGEIIYSGAFGYSFFPVSAASVSDVFGIGSVTKGFVTATILSLAKEGVLDLDTPVKQYLPELDLTDQDAEDRATLRDLLLHRTGLPTHDFAFYGSDIDSDQLFGRMKNLQFSAALGEKWQYSNIMYMVAGRVIEKVTGRPWHEVVREKVTGPIGMNHTSFTFDGLTSDSNAASGYYSTKSFGPLLLDYRSFDVVGPAGAMNSTVGDLSQWIKLLLNKGEFNGTQVLPEGLVDQLIEPQQPMGQSRLHPEFSESEYAFGWTSQKYRDHRIAWHTGDVDGFKSLVGFMPDDDVGFVILTNCNSSLNLKAWGTYIVDRALGFPETDWINELENHGGEDNPVPEPRNLPSGYDLEGVYSNPGYGEVRVESTWDGIEVRINSFLENDAYFTGKSADGRLGFYQPDFFSVDRRKLSIEADSSGVGQKLFWKLEPTLEPIEFVRE
jgi:CubicO group peptidase (beta-lactamase class C family)